MPGPAAEEESSASEQGAEEFEDAPCPEPAPEGPPWWQTTIDDLGRGVVAEAGVIQAALQLQSQAVAAAAQERADRREELRERREAEREEREQRRFDALEAARVRDAEKLTALEAKFADQLEKEKGDREPDFREFAPRAAGNPFGGDMAAEVAAAAGGEAPPADDDLAAQLHILLSRPVDTADEDGTALFGPGQHAAMLVQLRAAGRLHRLLGATADANYDGDTAAAAAAAVAAAADKGAAPQPRGVDSEVARLVAQATAVQLRAPSGWFERTWRPAAAAPAAAAAGGEQPSPPSRQYLDNGRPVASETQASFATRGLSAVHVLARHFADAAVLRATVRTAGRDALAQRGGYSADGEPANITPIHCAAVCNPSAEVVRCLVELGGVEQLRATAKDGRVPMHYAARSNPSAEVVRCLVELGGVEQLRATDKNGRVPMHYAARSNPSAEVVRCLVELGGAEQLRATNENGSVPMHDAAACNPSAEVVRCLVELGGVQQLRATDQLGRVPMHYAAAAQNPSAEVVRCLVELGGAEQLRATNEDGGVPMHDAAACNPSAEVVRCLVELGGVEQLRATAKDGGVPMHAAAACNPSAEVVRCLVELGGAEQLRATNADGGVPMHMAASSSPSAEVVRCLVELGGAEQLQATDKNGWVPMHCAARSNPSAEVVRYLQRATIEVVVDQAKQQHDAQEYYKSNATCDKALKKYKTLYHRDQNANPHPEIVEYIHELQQKVQKHMNAAAAVAKL
eukprot:SAG25_NODE_1103_length_3976_cov_12.262058_1_plen_744_part_00